MKKGFTLVELLAVIVVLALLTLIATPVVFRYIKQGQETTKNETLKNVKDAALDYALEHSKNTTFISNDCATTAEDPNGVSSSCKKTITVEKLINDGYYNDAGKRLKRDGVITIYKFKYTNDQGKTFYDLKVYAPEEIYN